VVQAQKHFRIFLKLSNGFFIFPGEKIGIEYIYCQTGEVLQSALEPDDPEEETTLEEQEVDDEGFHVSSFLLLDRSLIYNYIYV
jgi:hypothetical protein